MTTAELAERLTALEKTVTELKAQLTHLAQPGRRWWIEKAGRFAHDPVFDEIVRLGQEYRDSLRPKRKGKQRDRS